MQCWANAAQFITLNITVLKLSYYDACFVDFTNYVPHCGIILPTTAIMFDGYASLKASTADIDRDKLLNEIVGNIVKL